jgi:hypothetical protein
MLIRESSSEPHSSNVRQFVLSRAEQHVSVVEASSDSNGGNGKALATTRVERMMTWMRNVASDVFLPDGYPSSVSQDYLEYQKWDTLQALASSLSGQLSTQAILSGLGVGKQEATATSATIQWLTIDGTSMLARLAFAWGFSQQLDQNTKVSAHLSTCLGQCCHLCHRIVEIRHLEYQYVGALCLSLSLDCNL